MWRMRLFRKSKVIASGFYRSADDAARAYNAALKSAKENGECLKLPFLEIKADEPRTDAKGKPKSRFRGVVVRGGTNRPRKFRAQLTVNNETIKSDLFDSEEAAARWYDDQRAERGMLRVNFLEEQVAEFTNADFHPAPAPTARTASPPTAPPPGSSPATVTLVEQHEPADVVDSDPEWVAEDSDFDDSDSDGDDSEDDAQDVGRASR
jgi:hypothetical protein